MKLVRFILGLFGGDLAQLPVQLQAAEQTNYLERTLEEFIEPNNQYGSVADVETFPEYIGVTLTKTRPGLKAPIQVITDPALASAGGGGLDNGVTPTDVAIEQYTLAPGTYEDGMNLDLAAKNFMIVDRYFHNVKTNVRQAMQTRDVLARDSLLKGYMGGIAQVTTGGPYSLTTTPLAGVKVDDIRGLSTAIANGVESAVSGSNTLAGLVYPAGNPANAYAIVISAAAADGTNVTAFNLVGSGGAAAGTRGNGISGSLTIALVSGTKTLSQQDVIVAADAPVQFLPNGKTHWSYLNSSDLLTQNNLLDARTLLEDQGVPMLDDGTYLCVGSARSFRSLYSDQDFQQAWRGLGQSEIYRQGKVDQYLGLTFLRTTNAPRIAITSGAQSAQAASGFVHFPMVCGKGALVDAWYAGLEDWASHTYGRSYIKLNRLGLAQVITPPVDRMDRMLKMSWLTIRDMVAPSDVTVTSSIILTANNARRKRVVIVPHGAAV